MGSRVLKGWGPLSYISMVDVICPFEVFCSGLCIYSCIHLMPRITILSSFLTIIAIIIIIESNVFFIYNMCSISLLSQRFLFYIYGGITYRKK